MNERIKDSIESARRGFNSELLAADYESIHGDDDQIARLVRWIAPQPGGAYLDLGTGTGLLAFAVARHQPEARVHGVDIADQAVEQNRAQAAQQGHANLEFHHADGQYIDFPDRAFDSIASRYAFHHFPHIEATLSDARRVLKPDGRFVLADAVKHPQDDVDFVNAFQSLKPDGHVRIYTTGELLSAFQDHGFTARETFSSKLSFTRALTDEYRTLIDRTPDQVLACYDLTVDGDRAALTFEILNVQFVL